MTGHIVTDDAAPLVHEGGDSGALTPAVVVKQPLQPLADELRIPAGP
jgi:hypothetical protein